jgi:hypothetical protein
MIWIKESAWGIGFPWDGTDLSFLLTSTALVPKGRKGCFFNYFKGFREGARVLDREQKRNYVLCSFSSWETAMFRAVVEEAAALASLTLFLGMLAVWAQVIASL